MVKQQINVGTNTLVNMAKKLLDYGDISQEQFDEVLLRNLEIEEAARLDQFYLE
jgi:hypothetical protein